MPDDEGGNEPIEPENSGLPYRQKEACASLRPCLLGSQESNMRGIAAESLGALGVHSPEVVTALTACLDDPDTNVRVIAARSLGWCGGAAASSVPKLLELYRSQEGMPEQQRIITEALVSIDPSAAQRVGLSK